MLTFWPFRRDPQSRFEQLLGPHLNQLYRLAYRYTGKREDAEDLVQDLLLKLYPRLEEMQQVDKLAPWLARVLYRTFVDQYRRQRRSPIDPLDDDVTFYEMHAGDGEEPSEFVNSEQLQDLVHHALDKLKFDHRILLVLHDIEGYNLEYISQLIDTPVGTIKSRLSRARSNLRKTVHNIEARKKNSACHISG